MATNQPSSLEELLQLYSTTSTSSGGESWSGNQKLLQEFLRYKMRTDLTNRANGGPMRPSMSRIRTGWIK